jgi:hypothetical protein
MKLIFFTKQPILMRMSTVLSFPLLVLPTALTPLDTSNNILTNIPKHALTLVYILLSATFIDLDKHTSLQSNPLRIRNVYSVQAPDRLIQILHDR